MTSQFPCTKKRERDIILDFDTVAFHKSTPMHTNTPVPQLKINRDTGALVFWAKTALCISLANQFYFYPMMPLMIHPRTINDAMSDLYTTAFTIGSLTRLSIIWLQQPQPADSETMGAAVARLIQPP
jgi:hypothetical protein